MLSKVRGEIGYLGLADWWLSEFTETEQAYIESIYQPLGTTPGNPHPLTQGNVSYIGLTPTQLLWCLASWFKKAQDRHLARRILAKAEQESGQEKDVVTLHFFWELKREVYYADRDSFPDALETAIQACTQQIAIAPQVAEAMHHNYSHSAFPKHGGYQLLTKIYQDRGQYDEAINLAKEAKEQGWAGDWDQLISQCRKAMGRTK
ncbi:hypothetical protein BST81_04900 [Leptolyngbya sp. 'hensonii']|nr:hypothetical protein BST81_04900 [Leptolyngbya sp. 'hensonii']